MSLNLKVIHNRSYRSYTKKGAPTTAPTDEPMGGSGGQFPQLADKRSAVGTVVGTLIFCVGTVGTVMNDFEILIQ